MSVWCNVLCDIFGIIKKVKKSNEAPDHSIDLCVVKPATAQWCFWLANARVNLMIAHFYPTEKNQNLDRKQPTRRHLLMAKPRLLNTCKRERSKEFDFEAWGRWYISSWRRPMIEVGWLTCFVYCTCMWLILMSFWAIHLFSMFFGATAVIWYLKQRRTKTGWIKERRKGIDFFIRWPFYVEVEFPSYGIRALRTYSILKVTVGKKKSTCQRHFSSRPSQ